MDNRVLHSDAVVIPATLASTVEVFSEVFHSNAMVSAEAFVSIPDIVKIGSAADGDLVATIYGSKDGITFYAEDATAIARGASGAGSDVILASFAPYFKVGVKSTATGGLQTGHGVKVDVVSVEKDHDYKRAFTALSVTDGDEEVIIEVPHAFESVRVSTHKVSGTITDFDYKLYTSADGVVWYDVYSKSDLADASLPNLSTVADVGLLKYIKLDPAAPATGVVMVGLYGIGY